LAILGVLPLLGVAFAFHSRNVAELTKSTNEAAAVSEKVIEQVVTGFRTVRAFSTEDREVSRFSKVGPLLFF
jgi:ABC-type multidrug transport system fused ATPase/permease subunit